MKREDIKLGYTCNNNCIFCIIGKRRLDSPDRSTEEAKSLISDARSRGVQKLLITGGEPTIRKDIIDIISHAKSLGFESIHLESNGRMFSYSSFVDAIKDAGVSDVSVSYHSESPELYALLSGCDKEGFHQVRQGLKNVSNANIPIHINCVITRMNLDHLEKIVESLKDFGIKTINFPLLNPSGNAWDSRDKIIPGLKDINPFLKKAVAKARSYGWIVTTEMIPPCLQLSIEGISKEEEGREMSINAPDASESDFLEAQKRGMIKGMSCSRCMYNETCIGVPEGYSKAGTLDGLNPVER